VLMVACNMVMELFPQRFDSIGLGRVWRQEMQLNSSVQRFDGHHGCFRFMNDVIVEDKMDSSRFAVSMTKGLEQVDEKRGVLARPIDMSNRAGAWIERPGDIVFDVLSRRKRQWLLPSFYVVVCPP